MTRAIDTLANLARDAEPPPLDDATARRMIDHALRAAPALAPAPRRSYAWAFAGVAAIAAVVVAVLLARGDAPAPSIAEVSHVELPTGDRLTGTDNARFDLARVEPAHRRVHLQRGTLLADVARLVPGQRFEIVTAHLLATAKGTVFSVETDALRSRVRVYEGVVEVTQNGASQLIPAGGTWASDVHAFAIMTERPAALAAEIDDAVGRREVVAHVPAPIESVPVPDPAPAPVPEPPSVPEPAPVARPAAPSLDELHARALAELAAGKLDAALATAKLAATLGPPTGAWHLVTADALRGLGRASEAADAFLAAAKALTGADAVEAGYSAAYLLLKEVRDPERALTALVSTRVAAPDSPLEERGLVLHVRILESLGRAAEAKPIAERYLERFPHGDQRTRMLQLAK